MNEDEESSQPQRPDKKKETPTNFSVISGIQRPDRSVPFRPEPPFMVGPLPSPQLLREYGAISPEIVTEIISAFSLQGKNRRSNEAWVYKGGVLRSILGVVFAFLLAVFALSGGLYLVVRGHEIAGTIFGGFGLAGLLNTFLIGTSIRHQRDRPE